MDLIVQLYLHLILLIYLQLFHNQHINHFENLLFLEYQLNNIHFVNYYLKFYLY